MKRRNVGPLMAMMAVVMTGSLLAGAPSAAAAPTVGNKAQCSAAKKALAKAKKSGKPKAIKTAKAKVRKSCPVADGVLSLNISMG